MHLINSKREDEGEFNILFRELFEDERYLYQRIASMNLLVQ